MSSLQKTISYGGDFKKAPVKNVNLEFRIPVYEYFNVDPDTGGWVDKKIANTETILVTTAINSKEYQLIFGEEFIIGKDDTAFSLFKKYISESLKDKKLENLAVKVNVHYFADENCKIGEESLNLIYFPKLDSDTSNNEIYSDPFKKIIIVNKNAYFSLLKQLATPSKSFDEMLLLAVISFMTDLTETQPALIKNISKKLKQFIFDRMVESSIENGTEAFKIIKDEFPSLYDFPLIIPEIKTIDLGGTFTIVTSDNSKISEDDFSFYDLSVSGTGDSEKLLYNFKDNIIQKNATKFSFSDRKIILQDCVKKDFGILVQVKCLGSIVWSETFERDDPNLNNIKIVVPLLKRNTLMRLDNIAIQDKKLRGQVLELSKKCPLKDLTVLVRAKKNDDDEFWKIVGAGNTDSAGNFSMPYPFGIYTKAQAIVSLKPDHPAVISITAVRDGNQTISDDFLYLLIQDVECPHIEKGEECDCHVSKKVSRLPDYADLIESDEYSQDIGGACVNLSNPNRTLSEFNYQAIVRTSDPEVANYTLKKIDVDPVDVSIVLNALTASNAASNAALNNLESLNITLNSALSLNPFSGVSNATSNAAITALTAVFNLLNAALSPLNTASNAALGTALNHLNAALNASGSLNATLDAALGSLGGAVTAAFSGSNALLGALGALNAALTTAINAANAALTTALNASSAVDAAYVATRYELVGGAEKRERKPIDLKNPVEWQDAPGDKPDDKNNLSIYQAVTIATGHILHYKSLFKADGYSLGDLIYSLPLAPGQKKEIVTFDAYHTLQGAESQVLSQSERLAAGIASERDITNQLGGNITEGMRGSSSANTSGISAGFGTGGSGSGGTGAYGGSGSAVLGVAGGASNANSSGFQNSSRDVSQSFGEKLRQSIMQNAESYRQLNASVVTTVQEGQRYSVTSEVVANHNHCHALTMMYFEVLRHYAIYQELSGVEECVFVPLLMTNFTTQNIYKWRDILAQFLLQMPSETYLQPFSFAAGSGRQHPLLKAFDANERIKTQYANVDFPKGSYDDEQIRFIKGSMVARVALERPKTPYDRIKSLPIITKITKTTEIDPLATVTQIPDMIKDSAIRVGLAGLTGGLSEVVRFFNGKGPGPEVPDVKLKTIEHRSLVRQAIFDAFMKLDDTYESVPPAQCIRIINFAETTSITVGINTMTVSGLDFFQNDVVDKKLWVAYASMLGYADDSKGPAVLQLLSHYFKDKLIAEWDEIFYNDIVPVVFNKIVSSINITNISTDFTSETKYKGGERLMRLNLNGTTSLKRNQLPDRLKVSSAPIANLGDLLTFTIEDVTISYSTSHYNGILFSGNLNDGLANGTELYIPENSEEKRNPKKEDAYLVYKLIEHLNSNLEHYNKVLWYNLDPDRRYMLLDGFNIEIFDEFGRRFAPRRFRSLASIVKNDLITVTGNSLVFPVAAGYKISQSYVREETKDEVNKITLLDHYQPLTPIKPYRISVPSKGVFAEAVQGACNACEKIETDRLQDWNRFPNTDEPTPISPVTPPTVGITDWKAAFKDFATPMINIQNAPANPTPGAGLAGLSELLGKSGVFKDITGLEGNQANVIRTYLSNQENAKAFGEMAKDMAMQAHNTQNSGKIMDSLKGAKDSGALSREDHGTLVKDHLGQQIDGGVTKKAELEKEKQAQKVEEQKATTETIRKIPGESVEVIETKDVSGATTTIKARPKAQPKPKKQTFSIGLKSQSSFTGGVQRPLNGNVTLDISPSGNLTSVMPIPYLIPVNGGVGRQTVSLAAGQYSVNVRYASAQRSDLNFLREPHLGSLGVNGELLIKKVFDLMQHDFATDWQINAEVEGELFEVPEKCKGLAFKLVAEMEYSQALSFEAELGLEEGFTVSSNGGVSFDTNKLAEFATKIAETLKIKQVELVAALLSLFTVKASIDANNRSTIAGAQTVKLTFKPAILKRFTLTEIKQ